MAPKPPIHSRLETILSEAAPDVLRRPDVQDLLYECMTRQAEFEQMTHEFRATTSELEVVASLYDAAFRDGPTACVIVNRSADIIDFNDAFSALIGLAPRLNPRPSFLRFLRGQSVREVSRGLARTRRPEVVPDFEVELFRMQHGQARLIQAMLSLRATHAGTDRVLLTLERIEAADSDDPEGQSIAGESALKSQFLANMSHEIRTPLTVIMGYLELLENDVPESRDAVETIMDSANQLLGIVNGVLDMSRIESGTLVLKKATTTVQELADALLNMFELQFESAGCLLGVTADNDATILIDVLRVRQVFSNLISNALKFSPPGGHVAVSIAYRSGTLVGSVQDSGPGIAAADCERIFEPFHQLRNQTTKSSSGVGLGLAICQQLMTTMGGFVRVRSRLGHGATFYLQLPCKTVEPVEANTPKTTVARASAGQRVLVVDDDPLIRILAETILTTSGYLVESADDGLAAVNVLANSEFDLVLLDMRMPRMNGFEVATWIRERERFNSMSLLACSASALDHEVARCLEAGCDAHVAKPFKLDSLLGAVGALLEEGTT